MLTMVVEQLLYWMIGFCGFGQKVVVPIYSRSYGRYNIGEDEFEDRDSSILNNALIRFTNCSCGN